jgi:site-specific DNA-cytosine methylase
VEEEEFASDIGDFDVIVKIVESEKRKRTFGSVGKTEVVSSSPPETQNIHRQSTRSSHLQKRSLNKRSTYRHNHSHVSIESNESAAFHPQNVYNHPLVHALPSYRHHHFLRSLPDYAVIAENDSDKYLLALSALYAYLRILRNVLIVQCKVCVVLLEDFIC